MNDVLNFIKRDLSLRREELKAEKLKTERFMTLQILEEFKRKRKYNEAGDERSTRSLSFKL